MPSDLAPKLRSLADRGVYIGTSSWKYEGWLGDIYTGSQVRDARQVLAERSSRRRAWPNTPRRFPSSAATSASTSSRAIRSGRSCSRRRPAGLRFGFKVPEDITCAKWPTHARYGARKGMENHHFLDAEVFARLFHEPLQAFDRTGLLHLRVRHVAQERLRQRRRLRGQARPVPGRAAGGLPLLGRDPQPGVPAARLLRDAQGARRRPRLQRLDPDAGAGATGRRCPTRYTAAFTVIRALLR